MRKICSLLVVFVLCCGVAQARTWTNRDGKLIEAELLGVEGDMVKLQVGKKVYEIPLKSLSDADQEFLSEADSSETQGAVSDSAVTASFAQEWPRLVSTDLDLTITEETKDDGSFVYQSPHYAFHTKTRLGKSVVKRFAVLFEATREYVQRLPIASMKAQQTKRYEIFLFDTDQEYYQAGGLEGSAGVYIGSKDVILVKCESLGLIRRSNSWAVDYDRTNKTLPHEITHQLTDREYYERGAMGWFSEGMAEYVAITPYRSGKFMVNKVHSSVEEYVTGFSRKDRRGRNLGKDILMPSIKEYMLMSYGDFFADAQTNYGVAALLVTYFCHYDGEGDAARLKKFLAALKQGEKGEAALKFLLDGRSFSELEDEIFRAWKKRGVSLSFQS